MKIMEISKCQRKDEGMWIKETFIKKILNKVTVIIVVITLIWCITAVKGVWEQHTLHKEKEMLSVATMVLNQIHNHINVIHLHKADNELSHGEKVAGINSGLQGYIDEISERYPNYGIGYYDIELDSIIAIAPNHDPSLLERVSREYPYFSSYETGNPEFGQNNNSIAWDGKSIINVTVPVYSGNKIIGHTWANYKIKDVISLASVKVTQVLMIGVLILLAALFFLRRCIVRSLSSLNSFIHHIMDGKADDELIIDIPELQPVLQKVKEHTEGLKELNQQLKEEIRERKLSEAHFKTIFENFRLGVVTVNTNGAIIKSNQAFQQMLGYSEDDLVGMHATEFTHPDDVENDMRLFTELMTDKRKYYEMEKRYIKKQGGLVWVHLTVVAPKEDNINIVIAFVQDITEKKILCDKMIKYDRLDLIGELAAGVSHEVRNPMTTVRGFLQILQHKEGCEPYIGHFNLMIEELDRANAIITEFLSMGQNNVTEKKEINLTFIVESLTPLIEANAYGQDKYLEIEQTEIPDLLLNSKEIRQLILNLCRNGLEAMSAGGTLRIRTYMEGSQVVLAIQDEGKGITPEVLGKIGTPFFTTKENGTGLGLGICYRIAACHDATIDIDTDSNGTTFYVKFNIVKCHD